MFRKYGSLKYWLLLVAGLTIYCLSGTSDRLVEQQEQTEYCRMVRLYQATDGEFGWPDYNGTYVTECQKAAPVSK